MVSAMRRPRRSSSSSCSNSRGKQERVEREAVARRRDVRARDVGAGGGAGAGEQRQQPRMVGREQRQLGDGREGVGGEVCWRACCPPARRARTSLACSTDLARVGAQPVVGIVPVDEALDLARRANRRRRRGRRPAPRRCARARPAACGRRRPPARSRSRAPRSSWPFQPFQTPGPTARMSATVSTSSSFSRSGLCTTSAKSRMVLGSQMSRLKAMLLIVRCCSIEPGDGLGLGRRSGRSAGTARARCARPTIEWSSVRPLAMSCRKAATYSARRFWMVLMISVDSGCGSAAPPRSMSDSTPTVRIRCSSTV